MAARASTRRKAANELAGAKPRCAAQTYRDALRRGERITDAEAERLILAYLALGGQ